MSNLTPDMRTDVAIKQLLRELLDGMLRHQAALQQSSDPEHLHQYRVCLRKSRALLKQARGVFQQRTLTRLRRRLRWLGASTGPARDTDVYLQKFPDYRRLLPAPLREPLDPLYRHLLQRRAQHYHKLHDLLSGKRYRQLLADYRGFLAQPPGARTRLPHAARPVLQFAARRIWRAWRRVMREGRAIDQTATASQLHALRISCKRLRYLIDAFQSLYDPDAIKTLLGKLKVLQDHLGDFNDTHVQAQLLSGLLAEMQQQGPVAAETLRAITRLIGHFMHLQQQQRAHFERHFARFCSKRNQAGFQRLFRPHST